MSGSHSILNSLQKQHSFFSLLARPKGWCDRLRAQLLPTERVWCSGRMIVLWGQDILNLLRFMSNIPFATSVHDQWSLYNPMQEIPHKFLQALMILDSGVPHQWQQNHLRLEPASNCSSLLILKTVIWASGSEWGCEVFCVPVFSRRSVGYKL